MPAVEHLELVSGPGLVTQTGTIAAGSPIVTGLTTSALAGAVRVSGAGIVPRTYVNSIDGPGQVTLTQGATASGSVPLTFGLEPVTLAEAKRQTRIEFPDDDDVLVMMIAAARRRVEVLLRQTLLTSTYDWTFDGFPVAANGYYNLDIRRMGLNPQWLPNAAAILSLPKPPLVSVESVKYFDTNGVLTTIDPSLYVLALGFGSRIQPIIGQNWPVNRQQIDACSVRYTSGVANADLIGEDVKLATLLLVSFLYENRGEEDIATPGAIIDMIASADQGCYA
jgi:hypothetical protein